ncbi:MAG: hypothetical protein IJP43_00420 [Oscillospiraceae bacterium]|nr:hypothetical protein [Oscillospiraceae bacterium]
MTAFASLLALPRALVALWALLLCLAAIGSGVLGAVRKRFRHTVLALLLLAPAYFLWQVIFDLSLARRGGIIAAPVSLTLGALPWLEWLAALALLTLGTGALLGRNLRFDKIFLTPSAVKWYLDRLPCGICCWKENGRVLFSNVCMSRLCAALTGEPLLNGSHFREAITDGILTVEGRVWRFSCRDFPLDGETLYEMIATDITDEYAQTQALEREKAELVRLNRELGEYYLGMDEIIRRREILQAKVNIHDEMNRLMLSTTAAGPEDTAAMDRIFSLWEQNALLLCREAQERTDDKAADSLEKLAGALGLRLVWHGALPDALPERQRELFFSVAREAVVNAVKHAGAKTVTISFEETKGSLCCRFTNGGTPHPGPVAFTGGLANLSRLSAGQGATLSAETGEGFTLSLLFPKNQPSG